MLVGPESWASVVATSTTPTAKTAAAAVGIRNLRIGALLICSATPGTVTIYADDRKQTCLQYELGSAAEVAQENGASTVRLCRRKRPRVHCRHRNRGSFSVSGAAWGRSR